MQPTNPGTLQKPSVEGGFSWSLAHPVEELVEPLVGDPDDGDALRGDGLGEVGLHGGGGQRGVNPGQDSAQEDGGEGGGEATQAGAHGHGGVRRGEKIHPIQ